jgi:hypothetical protein
VQRRKLNTRSSSFSPYESTFDSSDDEYDALSDEDDVRTEIIPAVNTTSQTVKITLKNQHLFDDESHASVPLLDPLLFTKYAVYRELYANILGIWDLHVSQAEILKFNGLTPYWPQDQALAEQWYNPARDPRASFDSSRPSILHKPLMPPSALQVSPGLQSPRKLSQSHSPSRPLNPTAPAFTPQPQLFQAQGGITRLTKSSSSRDLHGLLNLPSAPTQMQQPERFDIHNSRDYPQQPTLLQRATDRARLRLEGKQPEVREQQFRSCIICWELIRGVHLVCSSGRHKGHMDCIQERIKEMPDSRGLDCECEEDTP